MRFWLFGLQKTVAGNEKGDPIVAQAASIGIADENEAR